MNFISGSLDRPHFCGNAVRAAQRMLSEPAESVLLHWLERACRIPSIDHSVAVAAILSIYQNLALPAPLIRWWKSPVAMLMAHEMASLGTAGAASYYGMGAASMSPELEVWLGSGKQAPLGRPIGMQTCGCRGFSQRQHAWLCPRITAGLDPKLWRVRRKRVWSAFGTLWPMRTPAEEAGNTVADVFRHQCTFHCDGGMDRPCMRRDRPVLGPEITFWPGAHLKEMAILDVTRSWAGEAQQDSCLSPFVRLAGSAHLAILREKECWLCEGPVTALFDEAGNNMHAIGEPALTYGDGTALYAIEGQLVPMQVGRLGSKLTIELVNNASDHHMLRGVLLKLYGIARYLQDSKAELIEKTEEARLWRVNAGEIGQLHILEETSPLEDESIYGEAPSEAASIAQAKEYVDQIWGAVIFAPPTS